MLGAFDPFEVGALVHIAPIDVEDSITIEKHGGTQPSLRHGRPRLVQGFRNADIDEKAGILKASQRPLLDQARQKIAFERERA